MKSLLSLCLVAGSAWLAGSSLTYSSGAAIPATAGSFSCNVNGEAFAALAKDSQLTATFTYSDHDHGSPAALFMSAAVQENNKTSSLYIQPIADDAPAIPLTTNDNLYGNFYITYKAADNTIYNTTTAPGNLEITIMDTLHKTVSGMLNCILYSSTKKDWLLISNGRFMLTY